MGTHGLPAVLFVAGFAGGGLSCIFAWAWIRVLDLHRWPVLLLPLILTLWATLAGYAAKELAISGWMGVAAPLLAFGALVFERRLVPPTPKSLLRDQLSQGTPPRRGVQVRPAAPDYRTGSPLPQQSEHNASYRTYTQVIEMSKSSVPSPPPS